MTLSLSLFVCLSVFLCVCVCGFVSVCLCLSLCHCLSLSASHLSVLGIIGVSKGGRTRDSGIFESGRVGGIPPETIKFRQLRFQDML